MSEGKVYACDFEEQVAYGPFDEEGDARVFADAARALHAGDLSVVDTSAGPVDAETWLAGMAVRAPEEHA